jgi:hypothetical protein
VTVLLQIDVFLPPGQHSKGTLIYYHLGINLAIVSLGKGIHGIRPVDLCRKEDLFEPVVAIGRQIEEGFLMATKGEVRCVLRSDYGFSTCKINKVHQQISLGVIYIVFPPSGDRQLSFSRYGCIYTLKCV